VHRDIKLENILIKSIEDKIEYEVRIADFGLAVFTPDNELLTQKCGTPGYVAPEVFNGKGYSYKADMFSLGSVFFNLLTGCFLFSGNTPEMLLLSNMQCDLRYIKQYLQHTTHQCKDLVSWMLERDPDDRPTPKEALKHEWFKCDKDILKNLLNMND
jgi:serine/threonine protein kinase